MSDTAPVAQEAAPGPVDYQPPALSQEALSLDDAMRIFAEPEKKKEEQAEAPTQAAEQPESAQADSDPATDPAEQPQAADQEENLPPIEPPRSWTQAEKERFQSLPRETQEYLHTREQERDRDFRTRQNELAEQRKAVEAERQKAEQVRQQYEAQLPALMKELESVNQAQFSDIKTMEDVVRLQAEDPFRFQAWQVHQMRLQAVKQESDRAAQEKQTAEQTNWAKHVQEENAKAVEFIPELADKDKGEALTRRVATELLPDLGFKDSELADLAMGKSKLSIYDHRVQRLLADSLRLRDIQKAKVAAIQKPVPPVQRPGTKQPSGAAQAQSVQALNQKLSATGSIDDALQLLVAQRKAS
jgi:hypothetical protein